MPLPDKCCNACQELQGLGLELPLVPAKTLSAKPHMNEIALNESTTQPGLGLRGHNQHSKMYPNDSRLTARTPKGRGPHPNLQRRLRKPWLQHLRSRNGHPPWHWTPPWHWKPNAHQTTRLVKKILAKRICRQCNSATLHESQERV